MASTPMPARRALPLWIAATAAAEVVGMAAAATAAALAGAPQGAPLNERIVEYVAALAAGGVEAGSLGLLQGLVLKRVLPGLPLAGFAGAFFAVGIGGWAIGQLPALLLGGTPPAASPAPATPALLYLVLLGFGALAGLAIGLVQALFLAKLGQPILPWVTATTIGWTLGFVVIVAGATLPSADWPVLARLATGAATGLLAGTIVGAVTAPAFLRLDARDPPPRWREVAVRPR